jgi:hypothetical protein
MLPSLIRPIKRFLLRAAEATGALLCILVSVIVPGLVAMAVDPGQEKPVLGWVFGCTMLAGWILTVVGLMRFRRRMRPWKIEYDAADWQCSKAERKLHPVRARWKRAARRILIWVPTAIAAVVVFFYPIATHLLPHSRCCGPYRVSFPWTFMTIPSPVSSDWALVLLDGSDRGRLGVTPVAVPPFWGNFQPVSFMIFGSYPQPSTGSVGKQLSGQEGMRIKNFRIGNDVLTCRQYERHGPEIGLDWTVQCETATPHANFYATFAGPERDLPAFYDVVRRVTTVN